MIQSILHSPLKQFLIIALAVGGYWTYFSVYQTEDFAEPILEEQYQAAPYEMKRAPAESRAEAAEDAVSNVSALEL